MLSLQRFLISYYSRKIKEMLRFFSDPILHTYHLLYLLRWNAQDLGLVDHSSIGNDDYDFVGRIFVFAGGDDGHSVIGYLRYDDALLCVDIR
mmetsp:Transcript_19130/g.28579  ORF Transcript_19130/g.28579 Transcript_19130/m.28579 type:complete len:92 (-) Transcript_19130:529-804(-)